MQPPFSVHIRNQEDFDLVCPILDSMGVKWAGGQKPADYTPRFSKHLNVHSDHRMSNGNSLYPIVSLSDLGAIPSQDISIQLYPLT
jgi:hypothetical protein